MDEDNAAAEVYPLTRRQGISAGVAVCAIFGVVLFLVDSYSFSYHTVDPTLSTFGFLWMVVGLIGGLLWVIAGYLPSSPTDAGPAKTGRLLMILAAAATAGGVVGFLISPVSHNAHSIMVATAVGRVIGGNFSIF